MSDVGSSDRVLTTVERAIALRRVEALRGVPMEELSHVAAVAREEWWDEGDFYCRAGDPPGGFAVLVSASVELRRGEEVVGRAEPGEAIGAWSIFDDQPRLMDAAVVGSGRALVIDRDAFFDVLSDHFEIARCMMRDLVRQLRELAQT
jgi:CRP-like cAMP-binding protein